MAEATAATAAPKAKPKPAPAASAFDMPNFEMPKFEMPKLEVPAAFREIAEKSASQAKENYDKFKTAAEEATEVLEDTYASAAKGASDYSLKLIEAARTNTDAAFDLATELMMVKSLSQAIELSTAHARKQFETMAAQSKELTALAQRIATETTEPMKDSVSRAFKKVA